MSLMMQNIVEAHEHSIRAQWIFTKYNKKIYGKNFFSSSNFYSFWQVVVDEWKQVSRKKLRSLVWERIV